MMPFSNKGPSFGTMVGVIGSVLIGLGVIWLIAQNWHQIPDALKIIILFVATAGAYTAGTVLRLRKYAGTGKALIVLGSLLYTWSVFLIAQIFSTSTSLQGMAWLLLLSWIGVLIASYVFDSAVSLVVALVEFVTWVNVQMMAFWEGGFFGGEMPVQGIFALMWLSLAILFYGLSLWHRAKSNEFARLYQIWTGFFLLAFSYLLSFQTVLPWLWPKEHASYPIPALAFLFVTALLGIVSVVSGATVAQGKKSTTSKELLWFSFAVILLLALIGAASLVSQSLEQTSYGFGWFGSGREVPLSLWGMWIFSNVIFLMVILGVIGYGTWQKTPRLINIGIAFFTLDVITRYIGFMMDFWGYTSLSVIFITGGLILIVGGWLIERWRRDLIAKVR